MKRVLLALAVTGAILVVAGAAPLQAQPAPAPDTLTGELLATAGGGEGIFVTSVSCDPTGESSFSYEAIGLATGPYTGPFTETGTVTLSPPIGGGDEAARNVESFTATFTIDSPAGFVTGTKRLLRAQPADHAIAACLDTAEQQVLGAEKSPTLLDYHAEIHTPTGTFRDRGTALTIVLAGHIMGFPFGGLGEEFTSELAAPKPLGPKQDLSTGTGQVSGHSIHVNAKSEDGAGPKGRFFIHFPDGSQARGEVTCHRVDGNEATVGGRIDRSSNPVHPVDSGFLIFVLDNGEGADDPPDAANFTDFASSPTSCPSLPVQPLVPIDDGNYTVHDG